MAITCIWFGLVLNLERMSSWYEGELGIEENLSNSCSGLLFCLMKTAQILKIKFKWMFCPTLKHFKSRFRHTPNFEHSFSKIGNSGYKQCLKWSYAGKAKLEPSG